MADIGELLFILRDSLCQAAEFSVGIGRLPADFQGKLSVLANYLNPDNFIALGNCCLWY